MPALWQWLGFEKLANFWLIIRHNGGIWGSMKKLHRQDTLKIGTLVGVDKYGNRYYENNYYFHGRNRWVEFADHVYLDYDGSQIPPEWHGWMHYNTDIPPTVKPPVQYKWMIDHQENKTSTPQQYVPYSTTRTKIEGWIPSGQEQKRLT